MTAPAIALEPAGAWKPSVTIRYREPVDPETPRFVRLFCALSTQSTGGADWQVVSLFNKAANPDPRRRTARICLVDWQAGHGVGTPAESQEPSLRSLGCRFVPTRKL